MTAIAIGDLARQTGVKVPTIRYYESIGLLPPAPRSESNRRQYDWRPSSGSGSSAMRASWVSRSRPYASSSTWRRAAALLCRVDALARSTFRP